MKAKKVNETHEFIEDHDPYVNLGLGSSVKIKSLLDMSRINDYGSYEIHSYNNIVIDVPYRGISINIKYVEQPMFSLNSKSLMGEVVYVISKAKANLRGITSISFKGGFDILNNNIWSSEDEGETKAVLDALNKYHGPIGGFEINK